MPKQDKLLEHHKTFITHLYSPTQPLHILQPNLYFQVKYFITNHEFVFECFCLRWVMETIDLNCLHGY